MKGIRSALRLDAIPQITLLAVTLLILVLIVASSLEYVSVGQAHALPTLKTSLQIGFQGLDSGGNLTENGSVVLTMAIAVTNPSPRSLFFEQLVYKAWIEDGPMEAGIANLVRTDEVLTTTSGVRYFFLCLYGPHMLDPQPVLPRSNGTASVSVTLSKVTGGDRFEAVRNITAFARAHGIPLSGIPWNLHTLVSLTIDGVPAPASSSAAGYLRDSTRVILQEGLDLGA